MYEITRLLNLTFFFFLTLYSEFRGGTGTEEFRDQHVPHTHPTTASSEHSWDGIHPSSPTKKKKSQILQEPTQGEKSMGGSSLKSFFYNSGVHLQPQPGACLSCEVQIPCFPISHVLLGWICHPVCLFAFCLGRRGSFPRIPNSGSSA